MEINKVLIAEDEAIIALDIKTILAANSFNIIGSARTYTGVLRLVREHLPDLLISPLHLNKENNYFEKITALQEEYNFCVLYLSAAVNILKYKTRCNPDYFHFLKKPFNSDELLNSVNSFQIKLNT